MKAYGIMGFYKFLMGYHIYLITEIQDVGNLGSHKFFKIKNTHLLKLFTSNDPKSKKIEEKYKLYIRYIEELNLFEFNSHFYFCHSYNLSIAL